MPLDLFWNQKESVMIRMSLFDQKYQSGEFFLAVKSYYYKTWKMFVMQQEHAHTKAEIMYVIKGSCTVTADHHIFKMKKGDFIFLDIHVPHRLIVDRGEVCRMLNLEFRFEKVASECHDRSAVTNPDCRGISALHSGQDEQDAAAGSDSASADARQARIIKAYIENSPDFRAFFNTPIQYKLFKDTEDFYAIIKDIIYEHSKRAKDEAFLQSLLCHLLIKLSARINESRHSEKCSGNLYIRKAIEYMHQHYDTDIKASDIAKSVKINVSYLQKLFREYNGITIANYLIRLRMDKAEMFLRNTDIPLLEISQYVGINSRQYFSNLFKKHYGISPAQYRQSCQFPKQ